MIYNNIKKNASPVRNKILYDFIDGPFVEILGEIVSEYTIKFIDSRTNVIVYETKIKNNCWAKASIKYFIPWRIEVYEGQKLVFEHKYNATGKRVFIAMASSSLGDTLAWIPYALEFKKKHNCDVVVSTFRNDILKAGYPSLEFVEPGSAVRNIYAQYNIGWFYDSNKEPTLPNTIHLQATATNILGVEYKEIKPIIKHIPGKNIYHRKYVTIATNSTAGCKFWTREGWQDVINFLYRRGYDVVNVSRETNPFDNCHEMVNKSIDNTMTVIQNSEFFIGLSSGLSWLAWTLGKQVVMISNFSEEHHEFKCIRVTNTNVCHGCWNNPNFKFDAGDWNWCPIWKNTPRQFECHRSISSESVIKTICSYLL